MGQELAAAMAEDGGRTAWEDPRASRVLDAHLVAMRRGGKRLREAVQDYERRLIDHALSLSGGQQRRAAVLLGVPTTTLNEKMARLGMRGPLRPEPASGDPGQTLRGAEEFRWRGELAPGAALEIQGGSGAVRVVHAPGAEAFVLARRRDGRGPGGFSISLAKADDRLTFRVADLAPQQRVDVDFEVRVPASLRLVVRLQSGVIEAHGVAAELDLQAYEGYVRILPGPPPPPR